MTKYPLVSIILPTYNRTQLLPNSIKSVIDQTYTNWELIVWDDGSTDDTGAVVKSFDDPRIQYFRDSNHGMSYALNQGIQISTGELVAFIDDDDQWIKEKLSHQIDILSRYPEIEMIFGNFINIDLVRQKEALEFTQNSKALKMLSTTKLDQNVFKIDHGLLKAIALENFIAFDSVVIRRAVLEKIGSFNEEIKNAMDFEYWWRLGLAGCEIAYTESVVLRRMKYPNSLSGRSLVSLGNYLIALDMCKSESLKRGDESNLPYLNKLYRNSWQNLITAYGNQGNLKQAVNAFRESLKYGFQPGSLRLLVSATINALRK